jgi:hypothetical protein
MPLQQVAITPAMSAEIATARAAAAVDAPVARFTDRACALPFPRH